LDQVTENHDWFDELAVPNLTTEDQVLQRLSLYSFVYQCLDNIPDPPEEVKVIWTLTRYFLIFAGGAFTPDGQSSLYLVSPATSRDWSILQIRDEAHIKAPEGFVFVRVYRSRNVMPPEVRRAFVDEQVAGVTMALPRYIAVLSDFPKQSLTS